MSYEIEQELINKDNGAITIYRRVEGGKFQCKIRLSGLNKYTRKSCKTDNRDNAITFATNLYNELIQQYKSTGSTNKISFKDVYYKALQQLKFDVENGDSTATNLRDFQSVIERLALVYFDNTNILDITESSILSFIDWRKKQSVVKASTLHRELTPLRYVFKYAYKQGYIPKAIKIKAIKHEKTSKPAFNSVEYQKLIDNLKPYVEKTNDRSRQYLMFFILLMANSGIRPNSTESRSLTWNSIKYEPIIDMEHEQLILHIPEGKNGARYCVPNRNVKHLLEEIYQYRTKELGHEPAIDEPILCDKKGSAIKSFYGAFKRYLRHIDMEHDKEGIAFIPYSLRHYYATNAIHKNINHYLLAQNMGTSVLMLQQHYIDNDPKQYAKIFIESGTIKPNGRKLF